MTDALLDRAGRKAYSNKAALDDIAAALFGDSAAGLSEFERSLMDNAMRSLVRDMETRILNQLAARQDTPKEIAGMLRPDRIEGHDTGNGDGNGYAYPILEKAGLLRKASLIEAVMHRMQAHRLTLVLRRLGRESSIASLMGDPQNSIIQSLLVAPPPESADRLKVFVSAENDRMDNFQFPLIRPIDLPRDVMKQLFWWVAAALRKFAMANSEIAPGSVDGYFEQATATVLDQLDDEASPAVEAEGVIDVLIASGRFSTDLLLQLMRQGEVSLFEAGFARITGLRKVLVSRLLYESGGESLAVACKAAGFDSSSFATIFGNTQHGRLAADPVHSENQDIMEFYDSIEQTAAEAVLEWWCRDTDFLYAIKLLEQAS